MKYMSGLTNHEFDDKKVTVLRWQNAQTYVMNL
jgi:hypothetical protein